MNKIPSYYQDDSQGKFKGIDFDNLQILIVSGIISAILFIFTWLRLGMGLAMLYTSLFVVPILAWVFILRHNKPKSNDFDFFESLLQGGQWELRIEKLRHSKHPFLKDDEWNESMKSISQGDPS